MKDTTKWKIVKGVLILASSYATSYLVTKSSDALTEESQPKHPRLPSAEIKNALIIATISGIAGTFVKFGVTRWAGKHWQKAGLELPDQT